MIAFNAPQAPSPDKKNGWFAGFSSGWEQLAEVANDRNKKTALAQQQQQIQLEARRIALQDKQTNLQYKLGVMGQNLDRQKIGVMSRNSDQDFGIKTKQLSLMERMQEFTMGNTMREIENAEAGALAASQLGAVMASTLQDRNITAKRVPINQPQETSKTNLVTGATALLNSGR